MSTSLAELLPPRPLCGLIGSLPLRLWLWHMTVVLLVGKEEGNNMVLALSLYGEFLIKRRDRGILPKVTEDTRAKILMSFYITFKDMAMNPRY